MEIKACCWTVIGTPDDDDDDDDDNGSSVHGVGHIK
jgi:hypothetical protein